MSGPSLFTPPTCSTCGSPSALQAAEYVQGQRNGFLWVCTRWPSCCSWVGCHPGSMRPLGTPADTETRRLRYRVHRAIDPLWRGGRRLKNLRKARDSRHRIYRQLAQHLGVEDFHVGQADADTCKRAIEWARERRA